MSDARGTRSTGKETVESTSAQSFPCEGSPEFQAKAKLYGASPHGKETVESTPARSLFHSSSRAGTGLELSEDQRIAMDAIGEWLLSREPCLSLIGPAGSGKTHCLRLVLELARSRGWTVRASALTHKAAAEVRRATGVHADTTHRLLGVSMVENAKTGEIGIRAGRNNLDERSLVIVDEASMCPQRLVEIATRIANRKGCKVLWVGDAAQLSPVRERPCAAVDRDSCAWRMLELTTIHRQAAGNPIIAAATRVRLADPNHLPVLETDRRTDGTGVVVMESARAWAEMMVEHCARTDEQNRYIGYTNRATDAAAQAIRARQYGSEASEPYRVGELLVSCSRCVVRLRGRDKGRRKGKQTIQTVENNDEVVVVAAYRNDERYLLTVQTPTGEQVCVDAFANYHERDAHLMRFAAVARRASKWKPYFAERDSIADLRSAAAVTGHRSQGSTYDSVFLNLARLGECRDPVERARLLYVALTRASRTVYLTGSIR